MIIIIFPGGLLFDSFEGGLHGGLGSFISIFTSIFTSFSPFPGLSQRVQALGVGTYWSGRESSLLHIHHHFMNNLIKIIIIDVNVYELYITWQTLQTGWIS